ncbi:MAG TPA: 5,10-methylene-tetrahydrofolate dehydrogenase [Candidatus Salinicoccus merdavium]|nr:5,10-methylene-tetrahydrofolate dehydrogenase [Candidatus Salinicoccus merdavium]
MVKKYVGIVAAPGAPDLLSRQIRKNLSELLNERVDPNIEWEVGIFVDPLTGYAELIKDLYEKTDEYYGKYHWNYTIFITDLPVYRDNNIIAIDINNGTDVGLISLPAFGWPPIKKNTLNTIVSIIKNVRNEEAKKGLTGDFNSYLKTSKVHYTESYFEETESDHAVYYMKDNWRGRLRLISGMSWANNPFNMMRSLSGVVALAFATGSFTMIFSTMWNLSNVFPTLRLVAVSLLAVIAMTLWIIISHNLWEPVKGRQHQPVLRFYNGATLLTLLISVMFYFAVLFLMFLTGALVLLPPDYVLSNIDADRIDFLFYIQVAWFATSLSTVVGAIGAGVQDKSLIRESTYGYRQYYRSQYRNNDKA